MSDRTKAKLALHARLEQLWSDERFTDGRKQGADLREFITAYLWAAYEGATGDELWESMRKRIVRSEQQFYLRSIYTADLPRYEPVSFRQGDRWPGCPVPKTRGVNAGKPCGKRGRSSFRVTDPETGEWSMVTYCTAHKAIGEQASAAERALVNVPEPLPNTGGLLPSYIKAADWPDMYAAVAHDWKPPYVGIVADDWPVLAKAVEAPVERFALKAIDGGREAAEQDPTEPPVLRLIAADPMEGPTS